MFLEALRKLFMLLITLYYNMRKLTDLEMVDVCTRYKNGQSSCDIAKVYNVSSVAIIGILNRRGIARRSKSMAKRTYSINHGIFNEIDNEDKAYWLGFLMADGYIIRNCLAVSLKENDCTHLQKLKDFLGSDSPIKIATYENYTSCRLRIYSLKIRTDLEKHGVVQNKTFITKYPEIDSELNKHFIRGYFDGDGCITLAKNRNHYNSTWCVLGTENILTAIRDILHKECGVGLNKLCKTKSDKIYSLTYGGLNNIKKINSYLYGKTNTKLDRKYNYMQNILKFYSK